MARERMKFMQERVINICKSLKRVNKWDVDGSLQSVLREKQDKKYPQANKPALNSLRTISIRSDPPEPVERNANNRPLTA